MGYELRREVRKAIPPGLLTAGERLLVLELADICSDRTREGWPGIALLAEVTDMSDRSIQQTLNRVAKKWIELRVPLGKNADGKPYFAFAGKRTTYRFPPLPDIDGATDEGASGATDGWPSERNGATDEREWCDRSVAMVRQMSGPSPQRTPQRATPQPPPPSPAPPSSDLVVVDAEIVEEENPTSSPEDQLQHLIDETLMIRPNWSSTELRTQITAALSLVGESFEAAALLTLSTARDPTSARPSRITAAGNPHLLAAGTALRIAKLNAFPGTAFTHPLHPNAHRYEPKPDGSPECLHCPFPEQNQRHRVPDL
ncbi:hypothetical protein [Actinoplanes sp. NPDC051494]|uniref:hypothetical protein n=1 Tax=Actinoplanes sp. NPDC051494 TaxID=3363907 RepID=UPI0037986F6D